MTDPTIAIHAVGLSQTFGMRAVLKNIDLAIAQGECVALTGASGTGKTTLLRCLASALRPSSGEVRWFGQSTIGNPTARRLVGLVSHESLLYQHLTLRENLVFAARMCGVKEPMRKADTLLQSTGMDPFAHHMPTRVSKGMRQRVAVARALIHDPRILLLDEPFTGLDAEGTKWLVRLLKQQRDRKQTVCFTTHDRESVRCLADRELHLQSGHVEEIEVGGNNCLARAA